MRVAGDYGRFLAGLGQLQQRLGATEAARGRLATGSRISRVSDDVPGAGRAMAVRAELRAREQHARNAADGVVWVDAADAALQGIVGRLQRAGELAIRGANTTNADHRDALAAEVTSLRDEVVELANSRHLGRGLFAGFALDDAVSFQGGAWAFTGDHGLVTRRVDDGPPVPVSVTAHDVLGFAAGQDVLTLLDDVAAALAGDDQAGIAAGIDGLAAARDRVTGGLATLGIAGARLEAEALRIDDAVLALRDELSSVEDVDLAETVLELQLHEAGYEAALAAFARSRQSSLVDFLR